jgi:pimeloyl-ACP methyl ester carboxylesterase
MPELSHAIYRAGHGEPLVLVHGFTATWRCWLPVLAELVPRFEVIAPTLHGHDGGPPVPEDRAHTLGGAADHLERLLDSHGVGTAHFAGNSMGGALALELAKRGRARSVVAISPGGGWGAGNAREVERIIRLFKRNRATARGSRRLAEKMFSRPRLRQVGFRDYVTRGHLIPAIEAMRMAESSLCCDVVDDVFATMRDGSGRVADLDRISVPVLVLWGEHDRVLPLDRHAQHFRDGIPGVEFRVLPGLGHVPMWDDPAVVAAAIADFATAATARGNGQAPASAAPASSSGR